jgi:hypothetical protein
VGYDIEFIVLKLPTETKFAVDAKQAKGLIAQAQPLDAAAVRAVLLAISGCKPGPQDSIDYLGSGLSYARLTIEPKAIHVENNCGAKDLLKLQAAIAKALGPVYIRDLQSGQLHDADSYAEWWNKPL